MEQVGGQDDEGKGDNDGYSAQIRHGLDMRLGRPRPVQKVPSACQTQRQRSQEDGEAGTTDEDADVLPG
jgi:hypothetical protein